MTRVKALVAAALLAFVCLPAAAANMDMVVMVDVSESMFPYFDDLMRYLIHDLLATKLHEGDTFHLLTFNSTPQAEVTQVIGSPEDAQKVFSRLLLLQPLGRYTDLIAALHFLNRYVRELPETNPKTVLLLTDGVHDPPPGSRNAMDPESARKAITDAAAALRSGGWSYHILQVPEDEQDTQRGLKSYLGDISGALGAPMVPYNAGSRSDLTGRALGFPTLQFPPDLGTVGNRFNAPFRVRNYRDEPIIVRLESVQSDGSELLSREVTLTVTAGQEAALDVPIHLPPSFTPGAYGKDVKLTFKDDIRISPTEGILSFTYSGRGGINFPRMNLLYIVYIVVAAGVIFLLVRLFLFMRGKLREVPLIGLAERSEGEEVSAAQEGSAGAARRPPPARAGGAPLASGSSVKGLTQGALKLFAAEAQAARGQPVVNGHAPALRTKAAGKVPLIPATEGHAAAFGQAAGKVPQVPLIPATEGHAAAFRQAAGKVPGKVPLLPAVNGVQAYGSRRRVALLDAPAGSPSLKATRPIRRPTPESLRRALPKPSTTGLPPMIEMRVSGQNSQIGFRNIHRIQTGSGLGVGGRASSFLVFLVPVPRGIAEIRNQGGRYTFVPLKRELFPSLAGPIEDCLGVEIPLNVPTGLELTLSFRIWVSRLEEINALMRSVKHQGAGAPAPG